MKNLIFPLIATITLLCSFKGHDPEMKEKCSNQVSLTNYSNSDTLIDTIVTVKANILICKITSISNSNIFYLLYSKNGNKINEHISLKEVAYYVDEDGPILKDITEVAVLSTDTILNNDVDTLPNSYNIEKSIEDRIRIEVSLIDSVSIEVKKTDVDSNITTKSFPFFSISEFLLELDNAISRQDYEKAAIFKKAVDLKQKLNDAIELKAYVKANSIRNQLNDLFVNDKKPLKKINLKVSEVKNEYDKQDIYFEMNSAWFGVDYSIVNMNDPILVGHDYEMMNNISKWQEYYSYDVSINDLKRWFSKPTLKDYRNKSEGLYSKYLGEKWISGNNHNYSDEELQIQIDNYQVSEKGIGLVFIVGNMDKRNKKMDGHFVWFNMSSKKIIKSDYAIFGIAGGKIKRVWGYPIELLIRNYVDFVYKQQKPRYITTSNR